MNGTRPNVIANVSGTPWGAFHLDDLISEVVELERCNPPRSSPIHFAHFAQSSSVPVDRTLVSTRGGSMRIALGAAAILGVLTVGLIAVLH
jgi:hypothetical protein